MLTIKIDKKDDTLTVRPKGRLDLSAASVLEEEIRKNLEGTKTLVLDLDELEYLSSAGLRVFITLRKIMDRQGSLRFMNVGGPVGEVFEITGLSVLLMED